MSYPRLAARLYGTPLLITLAKAEIIERVFRAHVDGTAAQLPKFDTPPARIDLAAMGATRTQAGYVRTTDGIALIQVLGSLVQRGSGMDAMSGLESYDNIGGQLDAAVADPLVRGILLEVDSPGGEGSGLFDLAARVRAADAVKPVVAHANEQAFSAAYALAASAGEFYVAPTGMVGSVGVIMLHVDQSAYDAKRGMTYTPITYGDKKAQFNPHEPLTDAALADAQDMVDRLGKVFVQHVADMRGIDPQAVRDTQAGLLHPDQAMSVGFVDGVASLSDAMQTLRDRAKEPAMRANRAKAGAQSKEIHMTQDKTPAAPAAPAASVEALAAERAAGYTAAQTELTPKLTSEATAAERGRIEAILTCDEAKGREAMARHLALKTAHSADDAKALLAVAPKESAAAPANPLAAAMPKNPSVGVGVDVASGDGKPKIESSEELYARRRAAIRPVQVR